MGQLSALRIIVDAPRDKATNFVVGEDEIMRFVDAEAELLARPFHNGEIAVLFLRASVPL